MDTKTSPRTEQYNPIVWSAPEFAYVTKTVDWYWIVGSIGMVIVFGAWLVGNWTFAVLLLLSTVVLIVLSRQQPNIVKASITNKDIAVDNHTYAASNIIAFNINEESEQLILRRKQSYLPLLVIPLAEDCPVEEIRDILEQEWSLQLDTDLHEPTLEVIMRNIGF